MKDFAQAGSSVEASSMYSMRRLTTASERLAGASIVIEVLGPAGAGKTTVVRKLKERGIAVRDQFSVSWLTKVYVVGSIAKELLPAYLNERHGTRLFNVEEFRRMGYVEAWRRELTRSRGGEGIITVLDHGPIFMLGMVQEFGPQLTRNERFAAWFDEAVGAWRSTLDVVLWLDAPNELLLQRIKSRERDHPVKRRPRPEAYDFLQRCRRSFHRILSQIAIPGGPMVLRFDTSNKSADEIVERLLQELRAVGDKAKGQIGADMVDVSQTQRA